MLNWQQRNPQWLAQLLVTSYQTGDRQLCTSPSRGTLISARDSYWPEVAVARVQKVHDFILAKSTYWPEVALAKSGQNAAERVNS